jgi:CRISPR-associated protein (TIGR03986 family)
MSPQQKPVSPERTAIAPYNFVELPEQVVAAEAVPDQDQYYAERYTGQIDCTLTAESPLYVRCGLTPEQLHAEKEAKDQAEFFYVDPHTKLPVIPGSSLRGMLRAMVEIVSFSKIERVTKRGLVYRAVGDTTSLGERYRERLMQEDRPKYLTPKMQAGYIEHGGNGLYIRPAQTINGTTFARISLKSIPHNLHRWKACHNAFEIWVDIGNYDYQPVRGGFIHTRFARVRKAHNDSANGLHQAVLARSGRMPNKKSEAVIFGKDTTAEPILIPGWMIDAYKDQISQEQQALLGKEGVLQIDQPVFYLLEEDTLVFFGHPMMFRLPYRLSPHDFIPKKLQEDAITDLAEAIFGYVRREKQADDRPSACAGRITVSDAGLCSTGNVWLRADETPLTPCILAGPKPTTFQHYLVQPHPNDKRRLNHYAGTPGETVIRGHKLYWHKGEVSLDKIEDQEFMQKPEAERRNDTQHTQFKPVKPGTQFRFTVHFENLSRVELGALLWVLHIAGQDEYRLKLGMGKPLGMGAVKLEHTVMLSDRAQRYRTLFTDRQWATGSAPMTAALQQECTRQFEQYILDRLTGDEQHLQEVPRIQALLTMLRWPGPDPRVTRYMEIERDTENEYIRAARPRGNKVNEYGERPVLPTPRDVAACSPDDILRSAGSPSSGINTPRNQYTPPQANRASSGETTKPAIRSSQSTTTDVSLFEVGAIVKGNRKGIFTERRGFIPRKAVKVAVSKAPSHVIGILPAEHGKGPTGGITARIIRVEQREDITYLWLEPV